MFLCIAVSTDEGIELYYNSFDKKNNRGPMRYAGKVDNIEEAKELMDSVKEAQGHTDIEQREKDFVNRLQSKVKQDKR